MCLLGVRDLMLTCFRSLSCNYSVGKCLGKRESLSQTIASMSEVAEGKLIHCLSLPYNFISEMNAFSLGARCCRSFSSCQLSTHTHTYTFNQTTLSALSNKLITQLNGWISGGMQGMGGKLGAVGLRDR